MRMLKLRWAPGGGGGNGPALWTRRVAERSSSVEPEDLATRTDPMAPEAATVKATVAAPRARTEGRGTRERRCMT